MQVPKAAHSTVQAAAQRRCKSDPACTPHIAPMIYSWTIRKPHALCIDEFKEQHNLTQLPTSVTSYVRNPLERTISGLKEMAVTKILMRGTRSEMSRLVDLTLNTTVLGRGGKFERHVGPQSIFAYPTTRGGVLIDRVRIRDFREMLSSADAVGVHMNDATRMAHKTALNKGAEELSSAAQCRILAAFSLDYDCLGGMYDARAEAERLGCRGRRLHNS